MVVDMLLLFPIFCTVKLNGWYCYTVHMFFYLFLTDNYAAHTIMLIDFRVRQVDGMVFSVIQKCCCLQYSDKNAHYN